MDLESDEYLSIENESTGIYREKASKFLAFAFPVTDEEAVKINLDQLRKRFHDANHHCYAYRVGSTNQQYRVNDDGEPSGSAGKPIYGQILSAGLSDILIVVVRYFGGTKLGIPGLIHAYKTAAREAINQAVIIKKTLTTEAVVTFPYESMNQIMRVLKEESVKIVRQELTESCRIVFRYRQRNHERLTERFSQIRTARLHNNN